MDFQFIKVNLSNDNQVDPTAIDSRLEIIITKEHVGRHSSPLNTGSHAVVDLYSMVVVCACISEEGLEARLL